MAYLNEYEILKKLGEGGFATVYKVRHNQLGYIRAIRVLNGEVSNENDKTYQSFLEECKMLLRLGNGGHPNIVSITQPRLLYNPDLKQNQALVEMEYVKGIDLTHYIKEHNKFIPIGDVLRFVHDISSALAYCHVDVFEFCMNRDIDNLQDDPADGSKVLLDEKTQNRLIEKYKVIHNDIHSGNIIRKYDGSYVLLDFGLSIEGNSTIRSSKKNNGVCEYWAPERFDKIISEATDVYAFGILIYEMLAGQTPFIYREDDKQNSYETEEAQYWRKHAEKTPPPLNSLRRAAFENANPGKIYTKDYPEWLERMIMKCLEKKPENRYANAKELFVEVEKQLAQNNNNVNNNVDIRELNKLQGLNKVLNDTLGSLLQEKSGLEEKINLLNAQLDGKVDKVDNEKLSKLQELNNVLNSKLNTLTDEKSGLDEKIRLLEAELDGKVDSEELSKLQEKNTRLNLDLNALTNENVGLKKKISTIVSPPSQKNTGWKIISFAACILAIVFFVKFYQVNDTGNYDDEANISQQKTEIETLQKEKDELQIDLDAAKDEIKKFQANSNTIDEKDKEIAKLKQDIENLESSNSTEVADKIKEIVDSKNADSGNSNEITNLKKKISALESSIKEKDEIIKEKEKRIKNLMEAINKL
jgi:serine/threonine protein kinase